MLEKTLPRVSVEAPIRRENSLEITTNQRTEVSRMKLSETCNATGFHLPEGREIQRTKSAMRKVVERKGEVWTRWTMKDSDT